MSLEEMTFYEAVQTIPDKEKEIEENVYVADWYPKLGSYVKQVYQVGVREAQVIAEEEPSGHYMDYLARQRNKCIDLRKAYIAGFNYFETYGLSESLDRLIKNTSAITDQRMSWIVAEGIFRTSRC